MIWGADTVDGGSSNWGRVEKLNAEVRLYQMVRPVWSAGVPGDGVGRHDLDQVPSYRYSNVMYTSLLYSRIRSHQYRIWLYEDVILSTLCANTSPYTTTLPLDHSLNVLYRYKCPRPVWKSYNRPSKSSVDYVSIENYKVFHDWQTLEDNYLEFWWSNNIVNYL